METLKIKTPEERASALSALMHVPYHEEYVAAFKADRAALHTSLVAAIEGIDFYGWDENNQRMIKEKTLTIINSIFKE